MVFDFLRRRSLLTHGFIGRRWASRLAYPADEHGVRIPVYGWVDATAALEAANSAPANLSHAEVPPSEQTAFPLPRAAARDAELLHRA